MTLKKALELLRWCHCTLCTSDPFAKELSIYNPTGNYDELGMTYLRKLSVSVLSSEVISVKPTAYNYVNIYIKKAK